MLIFVSSTYRDLRDERIAAQDALRSGSTDPWGMEFFTSEPSTPKDVALAELQNCQAVILIIGFHAGTLIPEDPNSTYTQAEFDRAHELDRPIFPFLKTEAGRWECKESDAHKAEVLKAFVNRVRNLYTPAYFENIDRLKFQVSAAVSRWQESGRPGARRTFANPLDRVAAAGSVLFDYQQVLQGRSSELAELDAFVQGTAHTVAIVSGRGGIGKTKLLRDWSTNLLGWHILWLNGAGTWHRETANEVPLGDVVIIADDAHRYQDLQKLVILVRDLSVDRRVRLIIGTRPSGISYVNETIARVLDETHIFRLRPLERLMAADTLALAEEVLGPEYKDAAPGLAAVSKDTPLVTVVGGRLIARGQIAPAALANDESFRRSVFDKFIEEYEGGLPAGNKPKRELLNLLAAIQPLNPRDTSFLAPAESFLGLRQDQILQSIDSLEAGGLLVRTRDVLRIVPDVLADYLLEEACVNDRGETTGFAEIVFTQFRQGFLANLLKSLAELDWRITQKYESSVVLTRIWEQLIAEFARGDLADRFLLLHGMEGIVPFQPERVLVLVRAAMNTEGKPHETWSLSQTDILREVAPLLQRIAYDPEFTQEALSRLWKLTRHPDDRVTKAAGGALRELAAYGRYKDLNLNLSVAEFAEKVLLEPGAYDSEITPLDLVDQFLEREVDHSELKGRTLSIMALPLNYDFVQPLRERALNLLDKALSSAQPRAMIRAVASLSEVLHGFLPKIGRTLAPQEIEWQNAERLRVLDMLSFHIRSGKLPIPVLRHFRFRLRSLMRPHLDQPVIAKANEVTSLIPTSQGLEILDAICTGRWERDHAFTDSAEADRQYESQVTAAVNALRSTVADTTEQVAFVERLIDEALDYGIKVNGADGFFSQMCRDPKFLTALSKHILESPNSALSGAAGVAVRAWKDISASSYLAFAKFCSRHPDIRVVRSAAYAVCYGGNLTLPLPEDFEILASLLRHKDADVRVTTFAGLRMLGQSTQFREKAIQMAVDVVLAADQSKVADEYCEIFVTYGINPAALGKGEAVAILNKFVGISRLEAHCFALLHSLSSTHPIPVLEFLRNRLEHFRLKATDSETDYKPVPWTRSDLSLQVPVDLPERRELLAYVRNLLEELPDEAYWLVTLFWTVGRSEAITFSVLDDWLHDDRDKAAHVLHLLTEAPSGLAIANPFFAAHVVVECGRFGPELEQTAIGRLTANALPIGGFGYVSASQPDADPAQAKANEMKEWFPPDSAAYRLFNSIAITRRPHFEEPLFDDLDN